MKNRLRPAPISFLTGDTKGERILADKNRSQACQSPSRFIFLSSAYQSFFSVHNEQDAYPAFTLNLPDARVKFFET